MSKNEELQGSEFSTVSGPIGVNASYTTLSHTVAFLRQGEQSLLYPFRSLQRTLSTTISRCHMPKGTRQALAVSIDSHQQHSRLLHASRQCARVGFHSNVRNQSCRAPPKEHQILSGANGKREIFNFPVQSTTSRIGNLTRLILALVIRVTIYIHTYINTHVVQGVLKA